MRRLWRFQSIDGSGTVLGRSDWLVFLRNIHLRTMREPRIGACKCVMIESRVDLLFPALFDTECHSCPL
jgi:hypothetical protein